MKTSIEVVTVSLQYAAEEYRKRFDEIQNTRKSELKEAHDNYKPGSKMLQEKVEQIKTACDSALAKLKVDIADRALEDVEVLRQYEVERVQTINEPLLAKIRAIEDLPMTELELKVFADKVGAKGDYWASRALANIAEKNGIDFADVGLEATYDTKMNILDQLTDQLNRIFKYYGTNDATMERAYTKVLYLSDDIVQRARQMYNGKIGKLSDSQKADRAYFTVKAQHTDIEKGVTIANVLRNAKGEVKNKILCRLAEDTSLSEMAAEFSGKAEEIASFKNGLAKEYRAAERALQRIRETKDKAIIENAVADMAGNTFFLDMYAKEKKTNATLYEVLHDEPQNDSSAVE